MAGREGINTGELFLSELRDRLLKSSTIDLTATLTDSKIYGHKDVISTSVPMINVALSGTVDGGLTPGLTVLAGPSRHFKTGFALLMAAAFLKKYPEGVILFYDSEFGTPQSYFKSYDIPFDQVIHTPVTNIEELKFDMTQQLEQISRKDHVMIIVDSIGNLASKKEVEDARDQKSVADMTRAKAIKSLLRIITPHLTLRDIPMVMVNHTYKEQTMYPRDVMSGGTGPYYNADNIWILGRQQDKDKEGIQGYKFVINIEKSRYVKERSRILVSITYDEGINKWSGLFEEALDLGWIAKVKQGRYSLVDQTTSKPLEDDFSERDLAGNGRVWQTLLPAGFADAIREKYHLGERMILNNEEEVE